MLLLCQRRKGVHTINPVLNPCIQPSRTHLVFVIALSLSSSLVLLLGEGELFVSLFEGVRVWLLTVLFVSCRGGKMAVSPLGISLDQLLRHLQGLHGA